ncbi:MAG: hypothetical protein ACQEWU_20320 [Bacillota bacterium]|uniref:Uncharacterized protein n=1 Tax=Virgibacillus salarius TaxID=447199 RepID=A0A941IA35_9BACI|nr:MULTISPECIES: hypothetical protein [Bacillaceae]NAZ07661.1 hypothetical protein [Agaribacter marinus]MBR7794941.1 hypothetical protein [Virgibacillus salarius]MCC2252678.1 hypothetical protein [Virgibacillus sp. AGTR]MDY7045053.1 hypothetical protein [Virgibacillus sp. M23]QRZ18772.1 hypothetical protein JUJ52_03235 [Virgibacillus sp. AGTR]
MADQFLTIEQFNKLLKKWSGKRVKIAKQELHDYDETIMDLSKVSYETNTRRIDDYQPLHALQLNGMGEVENASNHFEELPTSMYEIPLEDTSLYQFDGSRFALVTDRAIYTIEIAD